jgi:hypothetical protein
MEPERLQSGQVVTLRQHMLTHSTASALSEYSTIAVVSLSGAPARQRAGQ